ncbi:MAG TPA: Ig-like domain-containing protein [Bryobacteraceae bacterium]|nr:Ig-like domain-containing protein [Bryobacteraceae bacterium]
MRKVRLLIPAALGLFSLGMNAQTLFLLPGQNGGDASAIAFNINPFYQLSAFNAVSPSAYQAFSNNDGSEYYFISSTNTGTVISAKSQLGNIQSLYSLGAPAAAAVRTPDGQRLLIAAGNLWVINVANDSLATPSGITLGGTVIDVASSIDSRRAFALVNIGSGYTLNAVDLATLQSVKTLSLPVNGTPSGVAVGPNGLVYVGTLNGLLEIDPTSLTVRNAISVPSNGVVGKPSFTPDGRLAVAANQNAANGYALFIFDITPAGKTLSASIPTTSIPNAVTQVFVVSNNQAYAFSPASQTLYTVQLNTQSVTVFQGANTGAISLVGTTSDIANTTGSPAGSHTTTKYLFFVSSGVLYVWDIAGNQLANQLSFSGTPGALSVVTPSVGAGFPTSVLAYGDQQNLPLSGTSAPLVVRAVDAQGKPVVGVSVTFTASDSNATLQSHGALTNDDGMAETAITGSGNAGPVQVTANVGNGLSYTFTVNFGSSSGGGGGGGGGGGTGSGGVTIVSGQGDLVPSGSLISQENGTMIVQYTDASGKPVVGQPITFTNTSFGDTGSLQCAAASIGCSQQSTSVLVVTTDSQGMAQADYSGGVVPPLSQTGYNQAVITAAPPTGNAVTFYVTTFPALLTPTARLLTPQPGTTISGSAGQTISGAVQATISSFQGSPIPNVSLRIVNPPSPASSPSAQCAGGFALSDATGLASCDLVLSGTTGTAHLTAELGYLLGEYDVNINVQASLPSKIAIIQGNNQTGKPGQALAQPFIVQVTDSAGHPVAGTPVSWKVLNGTITLSQQSSVTDTNGKASAQATLGNTPGNAQVQVTAGSGGAQLTATFTATITAPIAGLTLVSGNNQTAIANAAFANPLVVNVTDSTGKPVANVPVSFSVTSGSATVATQSTTTDASGNASTKVTAGGSAGAVVVTASASGFTATFNLTVSPPGPSNIVFLNAASLQVSGPLPGMVSPGEIVTIQGTGLTPGITGVVVPSSIRGPEAQFQSGIQSIRLNLGVDGVTPKSIVGPLPTSLAGISVTFNGTPAPIYSVSNVNGVQQVTVQVPYEVAGSASATVVINTPGGGSGTFNVQVQPYSPGIFTTNVFGLANEVVAVRPDGSYVSPSNPARRGEVITIFVTGAGQTTPPTGTNESGIPGQNIAATIAVGFNNGGVPYNSAQTVLGLVGVYAISLQVPPDTTPGPQQPVGFIVYDAAGNPYFANSPVIPIQ